MTIGYVAIHCDTGREVYVYERIVDISNVKEASIVMGLYDIMCKIEAGTTKELEDTVMKVRKISHVQTTMTLLVF
ncbi:MAG: Lrp/AsnC ligand binding domain-containing protein [Thaumarchaeota archaeon]|nr:Lrp/AsnC ligand binding domain-containing protein [Nitrososphaerota archaeon]MDE1871914.1 Lrp/AsnC ligand binding domain-containing protein [Nitrososphaerota archaeon]